MGLIERWRAKGIIRNYQRLAFVAVSAVAGAVLLGIAAPGILNSLYQLVKRGNEPYPKAEAVSSIVPFVLLGILAGAFAGNLILNGFSALAHKWDRMDIGDRVTLFVGIFAGLIAALPFLVLFNALRLDAVYVPLFVTGLTIGFSALSIYALQSMDEILPWNKGKARARRSGIKIVDTNVIIDGRIYDVAQTGFLEGQIYVPGFVLLELQHIADSHDAQRRQRGRRGLEVLRHLEADFPLEVGTHDKLAPDPNEEVDARLVRLAKALGGDILTNDFNLNRVASLQNVRVLNLNDLAMSLRPNVLPQENLFLTIIREGNQAGQGIGYLEDGTMVVVENGKFHIGDSMDVVVTQVIQTERGKMIFAEIGEEPAPGNESAQPSPPSPVRRKPK